MAKGKKDFTVWVDLKAQVGFTVTADTLEAAITRAREEVREVQFINTDDVEYMDGEHTITGVTER